MEEKKKIPEMTHLCLPSSVVARGTCKTRGVLLGFPRLYAFSTFFACPRHNILLFLFVSHRSRAHALLLPLVSHRTKGNDLLCSCQPSFQNRPCFSEIDRAQKPSNRNRALSRPKVDRPTSCTDPETVPPRRPETRSDRGQNTRARCVREPTFPAVSRRKELPQSMANASTAVECHKLAMLHTQWIRRSGNVTNTPCSTHTHDGLEGVGMSLTYTIHTHTHTHTID